MGKQIMVYRNGRPSVTGTRHAVIISERLTRSDKSGEIAMEYVFEMALAYGYKAMMAACIAMAAYDMAMSRRG